MSTRGWSQGHRAQGHTAGMPTALSLLSLLPVAVVLAALMRRLLAGRVGWARAVSVALVGLLAAVPAITAFAEALDFTRDGRILVSGWLLAAMLALALAWWIVLCTAVLVLLEALLPTGSLPPLWRWPAALLGSLRRGRRYARLAWIVSTTGLGEALRRGPGSGRFDAALTTALERSGVTFIKLGQLLATRRDLVPSSTASALARLQANVAPEAAATVEAELRAAWGANPDSVLASWERKPLGSASIGQAHGAVLVDGTSAVLKIRRPGASESVRVDGDIAVRFAASAQRRFDWAGDLGLLELTRGLVGVLHEELDYRIEARNTEAARTLATSHPELVIPAVFPALGDASVLVLERLRGNPLTALDEETLARLRRPVDQKAAAGRAPDAAPDAPWPAALGKRLASSLFSWLLEGILVEGFFHADLHPGNLLLLEDDRLGILDFGAVGIIDQEGRTLLAALLAAVLEDNNVAASAALDMAFGLPVGTDRAALRRDLGRVMTRLRHTSGTGAELFAGLLELLREYRLRVPGDVAGAFRTLASVEESLVRLDPDFRLLDAARVRVSGLRRRIADPERLSAQAAPEALVALSVARRWPARIESLGAVLETGRVLGPTGCKDASGQWKPSAATGSVPAAGDHAASGKRPTSLLGVGLRRVADDALSAFFSAVCLVLAVVLAMTPGGGHVTAQLGGNQVYAAALGLVSAVLGLRVLLGVFARRV